MGVKSGVPELLLSSAISEISVFIFLRLNVLVPEIKPQSLTLTSFAPLFLLTDRGIMRTLHNDFPGYKHCMLHLLWGTVAL